jgi:hypothetical protein
MTNLPFTTGIAVPSRSILCVTDIQGFAFDLPVIAFFLPTGCEGVTVADAGAAEMAPEMAQACAHANAHVNTSTSLLTATRMGISFRGKNTSDFQLN